MNNITDRTIQDLKFARKEFIIAVDCLEDTPFENSEYIKRIKAMISGFDQALKIIGLPLEALLDD